MEQRSHNALFALSALISGLIFGFGLALSGMMNPARVIGFLDLAGDWDPTLMFVMGGALVVTLIYSALILRRQKPLCADNYCVPENTVIDKKLLTGAALFGIGWGLVGLCPGPALAALVTLSPEVVIFVVAMTVGYVLARPSTPKTE